MSSLPSGVRLVRLLNEHLNDIMNRERANQNSIDLYCTGPYWVAFERSAYQLRHVFPDSEITPMRLLGYPFPVVMVSVTDRSLRSYARRHILRRDDIDYKLLTASQLSHEDYQAGNRGRVYLSRIRDIIQSFLVGDHQDPRDDHHAQRHGDQISGQ